MNIQPQNFGKDHWSLLSYVEDLCVNGKGGAGAISRSHMRCNPEKHPILSCGNQWSPRYSTRLKNFFQFEERDDYAKACDAGVQINGHDDWDCLDDLEEAGYIEIISLVNGAVLMTDRGRAISAELRNHKSKGGQFATFTPGNFVAQGSK